MIFKILGLGSIQVYFWWLFWSVLKEFQKGEKKETCLYFERVDRRASLTDKSLLPDYMNHHLTSLFLLSVCSLIVIHSTVHTVERVCVCLNLSELFRYSSSRLWFHAQIKLVVRALSNQQLYADGQVLRCLFGCCEAGQISTKAHISEQPFSRLLLPST